MIIYKFGKRTPWILTICLLLSSIAHAQHASTAKNQVSDSELQIYRATPVRLHDLIHTKLDVSFDYAKQQLHGEAWIVLKPTFYATDSLLLDAKAMDIEEVALLELSQNVKQIPTDGTLRGAKKRILTYQYQNNILRIQLPKVFGRQETYGVYIKYVANPERVQATGSQAITDAKGLYFINPDGKNPHKPIQIWTQGETEASSVWFPTIDKPNQKTTSEITMTVDKKYATLSNGKLTSSKNLPNGKRADTYLMELPHAPYLFMMAVGEFAIIKDKWKDIPLEYYVEPEYGPHAKAIFGHTPEMMSFYSKKLNYDYPWNKYAQIIVRDFVSGAMENTTASLFGDFIQKTGREILDDHERLGEAVIAHELFHHWFGDLVTTESWSNLSMNESFADYGEYLWFEYKFGKDAADEHGYNAAQSYFSSADNSGDRNLVRFHYRSQEDMFDNVSYQKGGRIMHMLRAYLGDEAFFASLNHYLKTNAFKTAEAHQLRIAIEEVTGKDMNWFFNQWFFNKGYPTLDIKHEFQAPNIARVIINQVGSQVFDLPMYIDVYVDGKATRHAVRLTEKLDTFSFVVSGAPQFINVDAEKVILMKKKERRSIESYIHQYRLAPTYQDRREAITYLLSQQTVHEGARNALIEAFKDPYEGLRAQVINELRIEQLGIRDKALPLLKELAVKDPYSIVRSASLRKLNTVRDTSLLSLYEKSLLDSSYLVQGIALAGISHYDEDKAYSLAKKMEPNSRGMLLDAIGYVFSKKGIVSDWAYFQRLLDTQTGQQRLGTALQSAEFLYQVDDTKTVVTAAEEIIDIVIGYNVDYVNNYFKQVFTELINHKRKAALNANEQQRKALEEQIAAVTKLMAQF